MDTRGWQKGVPSDLAFTVCKRPDFGSHQIGYPMTHQSHNSIRAQSEQLGSLLAYLQNTGKGPFIIVKTSHTRWINA